MSFFSPTRKQIALLIDPDKQTPQSLNRLLHLANELAIDYLFVGGSLLTEPNDLTVRTCKAISNLPVVLFPGSVHQLHPMADAVLFLSLVSGRNAEFLIGQHVVAAPQLHRSGIQVLATGYLLIDGGGFSSVQYMSNTLPIPAAKTDIAVATALAAKYLGLQYLYLEAGSGALQHVPPEMVQAVKEHTQLPLIVGGGIRSAHTAHLLYQAGADVLVVGTTAEQDPDRLHSLCSVRDTFR